MEEICHVWHGMSRKNFTIPENSMMLNVKMDATLKVKPIEDHN